MKIAVFGLGYVGVVNLCCFAQLGHQLIGCDIKSQKVDSILKGISPIHEPQINELLQEGLSKGLIDATIDPLKAVTESDMAFICVGTPSSADGSVNLDFCINTLVEIGRILNQQDREYLLVFRSTIPPGTITQVLVPELKKAVSESVFKKINVVFYPEFLREGSAVHDFFNCSRIVVGKNENDNIQKLKDALNINNIPIVETNIQTAEYVKYVDNAFHALKIAFANEVYTLGLEYGIDVDKANSIFLQDKHLNISESYLKPGLPFGGSCLPKDLRAIQQLARRKEMNLPLLENVIKSNDEVLHKLLNKILSFNKTKILLVGLSFKNHTDDVRESPMLRLANMLIERKMDFGIYDSDLNIPALRIENSGIIKYIHSDLTSAINGVELIVVCKKFMTEVLEYAQSSQIIFNCIDNKKYITAATMYHLYS